jgi:putative endonuclease|tara:strand:+ start:1913 stop:2293 length:381 start_codon:yes stop_codon:yes gene_type:complete
MIDKPLTTYEVGQINENISSQYLTRQGLRYITQNFHSRLGEIDLIMQEQDTLVFIEVKYRTNTNFGGAISAISSKKIEKIHKTAKYYLQQHGLNAYNTPCRFDVVALQGNKDNHSMPLITWLKNAF